MAFLPPAAGGGDEAGTIAPVTPQPGTFSPTASFEDHFNFPIDEAVWQVAAWVEHGGQTSPERCYAENGVLNMIFINDPDYYQSTGHYLSAAIQTRRSFLYGRWEARLKPSSVPGVLNSMYTIDWGGRQWNQTGD